jgi:SAM-dependent methyltransferase
VKVDLKRGVLFESSALDYDQFRPNYPNEIVNEIVALSHLRSSSRLLEVGCGTGKATVSFAARGYLIDCVDPGRSLVAFAKRNCQAWPNVSFKVARFEDAFLDAEHYDLIYSAQAFHWVDPEVRLRKAARLLKQTGSLALLNNYPGKQKDPVIDVIAAAVLEESQGRMKPWDYVEDLMDWKSEIERCGLFGEVSIVRHQWTARYTAESYTGLFRTYSDYLSLPAGTKRKVAKRIRDIIQGNGGFVTRSYDSVLIHSVRN